MIRNELLLLPKQVAIELMLSWGLWRPTTGRSDTHAHDTFTKENQRSGYSNSLTFSTAQSANTELLCFIVADVIR